MLEGLTGTKALDREAAGPLENGIEHCWLVLSSICPQRSNIQILSVEHNHFRGSRIQKQGNPIQ